MFNWGVGCVGFWEEGSVREVKDDVRIDSVLLGWIYEQIYNRFDETREEYNGELAFMSISPLGITRGRLFCVS